MLKAVPGVRGLPAAVLTVLFLVIAAVAIVPEVTFQVKRDREEEMIHRGVQYSRAIRRYVKKFGRYPTRIEELENTNNMRFLRRRYKDPITGKDFRILRQGDVQMFPGGGLTGAAPITSPLNPQSPNANPKMKGNDRWLPRRPPRRRNRPRRARGRTRRNERLGFRFAVVGLRTPHDSMP